MQSHTRLLGACLAMALSIACILASLHDDAASTRNGAKAPAESVSHLQN